MNESKQATQLEQTLGTYTAFGMASRWLVIPTGSDVTIDDINVDNVTMDNVVLVHKDKLQVCGNDFFNVVIQ